MPTPGQAASHRTESGSTVQRAKKVRVRVRGAPPHGPTTARGVESRRSTCTTESEHWGHATPSAPLAEQGKARKPGPRHTLHFPQPERLVDLRGSACCSTTEILLCCWPACRATRNVPDRRGRHQPRLSLATAPPQPRRGAEAGQGFEMAGLRRGCPPAGLRRGRSFEMAGLRWSAPRRG